MKTSTIFLRAILPAVTGLVVIASASGALGGRDKYPAETVVDEEFSVDSGGKLIVDVDDMNIRISPGESGRARIIVTVAGPNADRAREHFEKLNFRAEVLDGELVVQTDRRRTWMQFNWNKYRGVSVLATITIPRRFDMDVQTSDGDLRAEDIEGELALGTSDGDIDLEGLRGPSIRVKTSDGDVATKDLRSEQVWVKTSDGDLWAEDVHGDDVEMGTSDGDITVRGMEAKSVTVTTSDGDIKVRELKASSIGVRTSDGDVDLAASGDELRIKTSDGDIQARIEDEMSVSLSTSDGNITLMAPADLRADVDLKGDRVRLLGGIKIQGEVGTRRVVGKLNEGGPEIQARASDGTVALDLR